MRTGINFYFSFHIAICKRFFSLFICVGTVRRIPSNLAALGIFNLEDREELMQQQMETETGVEMKAVEEIQGTLQHSQLVGVQIPVLSTVRRPKV